MSGTSRAPSAGTSFCETPAPTITPSVNGTNANPASSGEKPSTRWRYSVLKKNIANSPAATISIATFAPRTVLTEKIESRTSGSAERRSMSTKATSSTAESARKPSTSAEPQPDSAERTIP